MMVDLSDFEQYRVNPSIFESEQSLDSSYPEIRNYQRPNRKTGQGFMGGVDKFNQLIEHTLTPVAAGALQGVGNLGVSLANLPLKPFGKRIEHIDLKQYLKPENKSFIQDVLFGTGQLGADILTGGKLLKTADKYIKSGQGLKGVAKEIGKGGALGYALGESSEGDRTLGTLFGAGASGLAKSLRGLSSEGIAEKLLADRDKIKGLYQKGYDEVFNIAEKLRQPGQKLRLPAINFKDIGRYATKDDLHGVIELYTKNPSLRKMHEAQSDLGKIIRELSKKKELSGLNTLEKKAYSSAKEAQSKIRDGLIKQLDNASPEIASKYNTLTSGYENDVIKYRNLKALRDYENKKLLAHKLPQKVANADEFMLQHGHKFPEIGINLKARKYAIPALIGGVGIAGSYDMLKKS